MINTKKSSYDFLSQNSNRVSGKKFLTFLVVSFALLFSLVLFSGFVSAEYANTCSDRLQWIKDAGVINSQYIKTWQSSPINIGKFNDGQTDNWALTSSPGQGRIFFNETVFIEGNGSLMVIANWSATTGQFRQLRKGDLQISNFSNYTGFGFWFKGNSSCNLDVIGFNLVINNTFENSTDNHVNVNGFNVSANSDEWRYYYIDLYNIRNASRSLPLNWSGELSHTVRGINLNVYRNSTAPESCGNYTTFYIDDVEFVDNDLGSTYYPRTINKTDSARLDRYQESISLNAWLYKYGGANYQGNESYLNNTILMGDYLVRNQRNEGSWVEGWADKENNDSTATIGFTGTAFALAYIYLNDDPRLYENISIRWLNNKTINGTRKDIWLNSIKLAADYSYNESFPRFTSSSTSNYFYGNQHTGALLTEFLYYNITGNNSYLDNFNDNLVTLNNTWYNYDFDYLIELNRTTNIGFSPGYMPTNLFMGGLLYYFSNSNLLLEMLNKDSLNLINTISSNQYTFYLPNGSRYTSPNSETDTTGNSRFTNYPIYNIPNNILKQFSYNSLDKLWNVTHGYGSVKTSQNSNNEFRQAYITIIDYNLCLSNTLSDYNYRFPMNYSTKYYDMLNNSLNLNLRLKEYTGNRIESRSGLEFPRMLFAYDNNASWWIRGDYLDSNATGFLYSDENGNFTLAVTPQARIDESITGLTMFTESDGNNVLNSTRSQNQIWFSSSSSTTKHIASNLSDAITADVAFNVQDCDSVGQITYTANDGDYTHTYRKSDYTCSGNQVTINSVSHIEPATGSNVFDISYGCSSSVNSVLIALQIFVALGCVLFIIALFVMSRNGMIQLTLPILMLGFTAGMVAIIMIGVLLNVIGSLC